MSHAEPGMSAVTDAAAATGADIRDGIRDGIRRGLSRTDGAVIAATLALLAFLYGTLWGTLWGGTGAADVAHFHTADGREFSVPLNEDRTLELRGPLGISVIEIRNGQVRFVASPCRGKQCIHAGWLKQGGEFAACLPNRISVAVRGRDRRFDSINF